ncbi:helix-turn-helix domain-containing protein [Gordonia sp. 852002-50395_SCH5434458]|uniref:helix-turn-helix domain-containing protein n=1 Tax=Gordonia sp. 852002-50395_SCH5434458 TaxID=1834090 RepID=UPI0007EBE4CB|nr:helix-turn-helix transcriptional regulator [Gordonia sp. 852002-50395_SCH5434458]OBC02686.1 hypothetical protein A5785_02420 [Gordonia sp. 852002-50395_SCH5434458]
MAAKKIEIDDTGRTVSLNVTIHRATRGMTVAELAERVSALGRPLTRQAVSEIEAGRRRVDVDDLVVLAVALGVSPSTLLMPRADYHDDVVAVTCGGRLPAEDVWRWIVADAPLDHPTGDTTEFEAAATETDAFRRTARPAWEVRR